MKYLMLFELNFYELIHVVLSDAQEKVQHVKFAIKYNHKKGHRQRTWHTHFWVIQANFV